jgi:hypothetical protein
MRHLLVELLLRLVKPALAAGIGAATWVVLTGPLGVDPTLELAFLVWLGGAAFVLLVESGPI